MKTTIYLDIDGVLNAVALRTPSPKFSGWQDWESKIVNRWRFQYSKDMVSTLNDLSERPGITFKWLTTWGYAAPHILCPAIGINGKGWEVISSEQHCWRGHDWWKLQAIQEDAKSSKGQRFIWIDDEISAEIESIEWAQARDDVLAISPSTVQGLTRAHVEQIKHFAKLRAQENK